MRQKIVNKAKSFWKHGKHKGILELAILKNKTQKPKDNSPKFKTVEELMKYYGKN